VLVADTPEAQLYTELSPLASFSGYAGLLLLTENLDILANQLPYSDEKAASIALPLLQLRQGLSEASRSIEFLSVRMDLYQYVLIQIRTGVMLLRLDEDADLDGVKERVSKVVDSLSPKINTLSMQLIGEIFYTKDGMSPEEVAKALKKNIKQKKFVSNARCEEFLGNIYSLLILQLSKEEADVLFQNGFKAAGSKNGKLTPKQVKEFGITVASDISNVKKRKIVASEMLVLAKKLDL